MTHQCAITCPSPLALARLGTLAWWLADVQAGCSKMGAHVAMASGRCGGVRMGAGLGDWA
ncbi:MAG: hypothetical protein Q8K20_11210 [Gemmobacter sp.]|nr:hypothetical protein [Gemmobacter sp.]